MRSPASKRQKDFKANGLARVGEKQLNLRFYMHFVFDFAIIKRKLNYVKQKRQAAIIRPQKLNFKKIIKPFQSFMSESIKRDE